MPKPKKYRNLASGQLKYLYDIEKRIAELKEAIDSKWQSKGIRESLVDKLELLEKFYEALYK